MIPHERSLVEKWKNRPFALIGVNSDDITSEEALTKFRRQMKEMGVTWRSCRDDSAKPKVSDTWRVRSWPTLYFIDFAGVIRHKNVRDEAEMEKVLDAMIQEAEKVAAGGKK